MQENLLRAMRARRPSIRERWVDLLHAERVTTPLANPKVLEHLINETLDEVFAALGGSHEGHPIAATPAIAAARAHCACGRNPLLAYFLAGEQALLEALVHAQVETPELSPGDRSMAVTGLYVIVRSIARGEIESFCALCQHRPGHPAGPADPPAAPAP